MSDPSQVRVDGPLESFAVGLADELLREGFTPNAARFQMHLMAHLSRWLAGRELNAGDLDASQVERFLTHRRDVGYTMRLTCKAMQPILSYLRGLGVTPEPVASAPNGPVEVALERYRRYLTAERGLRSVTAGQYVDMVRPFLHDRISPDGFDLGLEHLTTADVSSFVLAHCPGYAPSTAKLIVTALRSLLGFLLLEGAIRQPLAAAVPPVIRRRLSGLPRALEPEQVRSLLASCDRRTRHGCRDFAILTTLVRLGLRAGEVVALGLDDVHWRGGEIIVLGKGNRADRLPLPVDVGEALADYLRRGRPATAQGRTVFVRIKAPHRSLSSSGVTQVVAAAARRAGLEQIYAHRLRHTAAVNILRAGASLTEIGQLLRHRRTMTTAIYAKVHRQALRTMARPWPGGVA